MTSKRLRYPTAAEIRDFTKATGLPAPLVIRDLVRIVELFQLLDDEKLGATGVLTGGMALRLFASTRISLRDLDLVIVGGNSSMTVDVLAGLLGYEDPWLTIVPEKPEEWGRRDLFSAAPLQFESRFNPTRLASRDRWLKVDVSLRGTELKPIPMRFIHGYPFKLGVEGEIVKVMHPIEMFAEKIVAYGIFQLSKHLADLAYMSTAVPGFIGQSDWLTVNADEIRRVSRRKVDANLDRQPKLLAERGIESFDDMRESFEHPERFDISSGWNSSVFYHGRAAQLLGYDAAVYVVQKLVLPLLWPE
jgi:hypothetical protein